MPKGSDPKRDVMPDMDPALQAVADKYLADDGKMPPGSLTPQEKRNVRRKQMVGTKAKRSESWAQTGRSGPDDEVRPFGGRPPAWIKILTALTPETQNMKRLAFQARVTSTEFRVGMRYLIVHDYAEMIRGPKGGYQITKLGQLQQHQRN